LSIVGSGVFAMAGLLFSASPAPAQGTWGQAVEVTAPANAAPDPSADLAAVSCSSAGNCTATGSYTFPGATQASAATETSGAWAQAVEVTPPTNSGNSFPGASLSLDPPIERLI
jgi:hypothetical protein